MKVHQAITWGIELLLIALLPLSIYNQAYLQAVAAALAIVISFLPAIAKRNYRITLPWTFEALILLGLYLHVGGLIFGWYATYAWWDIVTHLLGSGIIAMLGFLMVFSLYRAGKIHVTLAMMGVFTFVFAMAIGGLWEITEFATDIGLGTRNQGSNNDTNGDLIADAIAAIIVSVLGMQYLKRLPEARVERNIEKLLKNARERRLFG